MLIIGLMSGTSADGLDVALCQISQDSGRMNAAILATVYQAYDSQLRESILDNCDPAKSRIDLIAQLHADIGDFSAGAILRLIDESGYSVHDIDLVGSHGQTLWHNVLPDGRVSVSFQVGEAAIIAERTGITTISNFRARDVAAGWSGCACDGLCGLVVVAS